MDFPTLGLNFDLTQVVESLRTLDQARGATLRFGEAVEQTASKVEGASRRMQSATTQAAREASRSASRPTKTVEERQLDAATRALTERMAFQRRMSAQRVAEERREAAEIESSQRASFNTRTRMARQQAQEASQAARQAARAQADADRQAQASANLVLRARLGMAQAQNQASAASIRTAEAEARARLAVTQAEIQQIRMAPSTEASLAREAMLVDRLAAELQALALARGRARAASTGMDVGLATAAAGAGTNKVLASSRATLDRRSAQFAEEVTAGSARARTGLTGFIQSIGQYLGLMPRAARETRNFGNGLSGLNESVGRIRNTFLNARFVVAAFLGALAVGPIVQMVDAMTALDARIGIYANRASDVPFTFEALYQAAQTARQPLEAMGLLYSRLAPMANQLGKSQMDLVGVTETIAKSFAITGSSAAEAASSTQQLAQALASNRLGGDELRSLAENAPVLLNEVARALGMNAGQFIKWAQAGNANAAVVIGAIEKAKERIDTMFAAMPVTIGQSVTVVSNALTHLVDRVNIMTGASQQIASFITSFAGMLESEDTINRVATAVTVLMQAIQMIGTVIGTTATYLPTLAAGFAALLVAQQLPVILAAVSAQMAIMNAAAAIAGTRMVLLSGAMAATAGGARALWAAMGGLNGIMTGLAVGGVVALAAAFNYLHANEMSAAEATEAVQRSQEGAIGAIQRAISFAETYGLETENLNRALREQTGTSADAAAATDQTSDAHAKARQRALDRANAERVLTLAMLQRAAAETTTEAAKLRTAARVDQIDADAGALALRSPLARLRAPGQNSYDQAQADVARRRREAEEKRRQAEGLDQSAATLRGLAGQFENPLSADQITVPDTAGDASNSAAAKATKGLDGAINRLSKMREEVETLNQQIKALLANPLDPLADFAARISGAGDEAAAQYTAGKAADAGFAARARTIAQQKEEAEIRLQLVQGLVQEQRERTNEAAVLAISSTARARQTAVMAAFWTSGSRSAEGYAEALRAATAADVEGQQRAEELRIAQEYGVESLDKIAEAYAAATGASMENAQALEDQAIATAKATGAVIALTQAEKDQAAAAEASNKRLQQITDLNAYAVALGRGAEALAEYNRQARIRAAIEDNRGLDTKQAEGQVNDQISAEDRVARAERAKAFAEELDLARLSTAEREIQAEAMARVAEAIARGSQDAAELSVEAQRAQVAYERAALAIRGMGSQVKDDLRRAFIDQDFKGFGDRLRQTMRAAVYDALLAKPINMVVDAVVNVVTKGLEGILKQIMGASDGAQGGDGGFLGQIGSWFKDGTSKMGDQLKGFMDKIPQGITKGFQALGKFAGQAGAGYGAGTSIADMFGIKGSGRGSQQWLDMGASIIGTAIGGPIGGAIATIASRLVGSLFGDKKRPLAVTALEVQNGQFVSKGTQAYDGGPRDEIDAAGKELAGLLNSLAKAFNFDLTKASGLYTTFGWTGGENTKALGGEGFFGGMLKEFQSIQGKSLDQIKGSALGRGVDLSRVKDAEEALDLIVRKMVVAMGEAVGQPFTEAEKRLLNAADSLEEAAKTLFAARNVESSLQRALLKFTNPTEFAMANLRDQQMERRNQIRDYVNQGLISQDRLPGIESLLQQLERNEIAEALASLTEGANGAAASLKDIQAAQEKIRDYVDGLRTGNLSPLSPAAQLELSRNQFETMLAKAQGGDLAALQGITDSSSDFLAAAQRFYGSSEAYAAIFDRVYSKLDALGNQEFEDPLIDAIDSNFDRLIEAIEKGFGLFADIDGTPTPGTGGGTTTPPPVTPPPVTAPPPVYTPPVYGGGGRCPAPWTPVLLADGRVVRADEVKVGDVVRTQHEITLEWGDHTVVAVETGEAERWDLVLEDGRVITVTPNHRFHGPDGWTELQDLKPGDRLDGRRPGVVRSVVRRDVGLVVKITVDEAHTYQTDDVLSHNIKMDRAPETEYIDAMTAGFRSVNDTLAGVAEAVVKSNDTGYQQMSDALVDGPSLEKSVKGGSVSQKKVA